MFSSTQPSLRARVLPRFPAQVIAGTGITITKNGSVYVFAVAPYSNIPLTALAPVNSDTLVGRDAAGVGPPQQLTVGAGIGFTGAGGIQLQPNQRLRTLSTIITGAPISAGVKADLYVPFSCTLTAVTLLADQTGSVVLDVWKAPYATYPPVVGNTITTSALKPTLVSALKSQITALTGWIVAVTAGDVLRFNVNSAATITRLTVALDAVTV